MAMHAYWLYYSYPQSQTVENNDYLAGQSDNWKKEYYFFVYTTGGGDLTNYDTDQTTRQMYLWVAAFCLQLVNHYAVPALAEKWDLEHSRLAAEEEARVAKARAAAAEN